ncbi:hypothetical protein HELRODRAFT_81669 [Helobdella robusta]|uniref:Fibrinogen C-terminal domain-containing protein n=1 Tax=Helobdella robusta TaxID=6412 RepID=T1G4H1_HELRO|nr:hypothetical protein HELRODRAFT_81669 [Helobdella robusta]ESO01650.1 hypothetical protein HELRODRAFT_81669 [Helobdella robusta]
MNKTETLQLPSSPNSAINVLRRSSWLVIQQRIDNSLSFNQTWEAYKYGFGVYNENFWLGLENIYNLTKSRMYKLRIEVYAQGIWVSDEYDSFEVGSESLNYKLKVSNYSGDNLDIMNYVSSTSQMHNGKVFSTFDRDNSPLQTNPGLKHASGNWFDSYSYAQNLNGPYNQTLQYYMKRFNRLTNAQQCRMMIKLSTSN